MGIRSDVGIALKNEAMHELETNHTDALKEIRALADHHLQTKEGHLFIMESVKWNDYFDDVAAIQEALYRMPTDDFLFLELCHDFPNSNENDIGGWEDNPWGLEKIVKAELFFNTSCSIPKVSHE